VQFSPVKVRNSIPVLTVAEFFGVHVKRVSRLTSFKTDDRNEKKRRRHLRRLFDFVHRDGGI
jgi:hypothetical protein